MTHLSTGLSVEGAVAEAIRLARAGDRVVLDYAGERSVAIVPVEDLELLEELEDEVDIEAAEAELAEMRQTGEKSIPWAEAKALLASIED